MRWGDLALGVLVAAVLGYGVWLVYERWQVEHVVGVSDPDGGYQVAGDPWDQLRELTPLLGLAVGLGAVVGGTAVYLIRSIRLRHRLAAQIEDRVRERERQAQEAKDAANHWIRHYEVWAEGEREAARREVQQAQAAAQAADARADRAEARAAEAEQKKQGAEHAYRRLYNRLQREKERP